MNGPLCWCRTEQYNFLTKPKLPAKIKLPKNIHESAKKIKLFLDRNQHIASDKFTDSFWKVLKEPIINSSCNLFQINMQRMLNPYSACYKSAASNNITMFIFWQVHMQLQEFIEFFCDNSRFWGFCGKKAWVKTNLKSWQPCVICKVHLNAFFVFYLTGLHGINLILSGILLYKVFTLYLHDIFHENRVGQGRATNLW